MKANPNTLNWMCDKCNIDLHFDIKTRLYCCPKCNKYYEIRPTITDNNASLEVKEFYEIKPVTWKQTQQQNQFYK